MGINSAIARLKTGTYTVTRIGNGTTVLGRYTPAASSTFPIDAVVQPLTPRTLIVLPEGVRSEDVRLIHTTTPLRTRDNNGEADAISIAGESFVVWRVSGPWTIRGNTHYEAHVSRQGKP